MSWSHVMLNQDAHWTSIIKLALLLEVIISRHSGINFVGEGLAHGDSCSSLRPTSSVPLAPSRTSSLRRSTRSLRHSGATPPTSVKSTPASSFKYPQRPVKYQRQHSSDPSGLIGTDRVQLEKQDSLTSTRTKMYGRHYRAFRDARRPEKTSGGPACLKFNQQDFYGILDVCDAKRRPFTDPTFPPDISSLCYIPYRDREDVLGATSIRLKDARESYGSPRLLRHIEWRRPKDLNPRSRLLSGGRMFRGDLVEGQRGSVNFAAATAALALRHELFFQVMPDDQCPIAFEDDWGIYKFRFWRYGNWTEVVVDDRLPSIGGEMLYTHTMENDEHWMCIMEKAYAKFNGCYDVVTKIPLAEMLQHLTGGITEILNLTKFRDGARRYTALGRHLEESLQKRALILGSPVKSKETIMCGLDSDLPYIVTRVKPATQYHPLLVCLYSPFGASHWVGPWGRDATEWQHFNHEDLYALGLVNESEYDFWIAVEDLVEHFATFHLAHQSSETVLGVINQLDPSLTPLLRCGVYGNWVRDKTDGGAPNNSHFLTHNSQYLITQNLPSETPCVISLVQRFRPRSTPHEGFICMGFSVFKAPENMQYRMTDLKEAPVAIATYAFRESISIRVMLPVGNYVIIPTTYKPGVAGEYLLRCISTAELYLRALKTAPPSITKKQCLDVEVVQAENLPDVRYHRDCSPAQQVYCTVRCGKDKCSLPVQYGPNPKWNNFATFYAKSPYRKAVTVEIWYKSDVPSESDVCVATSCEIPIRPGNHRVISELVIPHGGSVGSTGATDGVWIGGRKKNVRCAGTVTLIVRYNPLPSFSNRSSVQTVDCRSVDTPISGITPHKSSAESSAGTWESGTSRTRLLMGGSGGADKKRSATEPRKPRKPMKPTAHTISRFQEGPVVYPNPETLAARTAVLDSINRSRNIPRSQVLSQDSMDESYLDHVKFTVNSDKTLSPHSSYPPVPPHRLDLGGAGTLSLTARDPLHDSLTSLVRRSEDTMDSVQPPPYSYEDMPSSSRYSNR